MLLIVRVSLKKHVFEAGETRLLTGEVRQSQRCEETKPIQSDWDWRKRGIAGLSAPSQQRSSDLPCLAGRKRECVPEGDCCCPPWSVWIANPGIHDASPPVRLSKACVRHAVSGLPPPCTEASATCRCTPYPRSLERCSLHGSKRNRTLGLRPRWLKPPQAQRNSGPWHLMPCPSA